MSNWNLYNSGLSAVFGTSETTATATATSAGTPAFTKGSWQQLTASTSHDWEAFWVLADSSAQGQFTLDIGVGAAGSEQVLANDLWSAATLQSTWYVPLRVAAGSRVAVRTNASGAFQGFDQGAFICGIPASPTRNYGGCHWQTNLSAATITGTACDPGAVALTKGSWNTLISSSSFNASWLGFTVAPNQNGGLSGTTTVNCNYLVDIGIGAAASEKVIVQDWHAFGLVGSGTNLRPVVWFPADIAAGSRISARAMCDQTNATDRVPQVILYLAG